MDFNKYYLEQAVGDYPVFRGVAYQRGYGLGGVLRKFFSWVYPLFQQHAIPAAKNIGKEVIQNLASAAVDAIEGKQSNSKEKVENFVNKITNQSGKGYKRKLKTRNLKTITKKLRKRKLDIFD